MKGNLPMYAAAHHARAMIASHPLVFSAPANLASHFPVVAAALRGVEQHQRDADGAARFIPIPNRSTEQ